ncbi:MAG: QueT transporter family protein, partial [Clostridiales bacterium]|nr:QueT transporter family protein [Clostridiales bacterium]
MGCRAHLFLHWRKIHMTKTSITTRQIALCGLIAAVYAALTVATSWMAYGPFQFRIAEALCVLPAFLPITSLGL